MLFKYIPGQQDLKLRLLQSVRESRISHAQLFLGPQGSGALPLAIAYAQYICCTDKTDEDSCGQCPSCIKYNKLIHPDLHFAYPVAISKEVKVSTHVLPKWRDFIIESPFFSLYDWFEQLEAENKQAVIGAEESAEIMRKLNLTTYESQYKIMIIWMAEKMNPSAANKLLKILEEPPENTLFLLVCESEEQMLSTILSRTQLIRISKTDDASLREALSTRYQLGEEEVARIAFLVDGNINEAFRLAQQENKNFQNVELFRDWMRICLRFDTLKVIKWTEQMAGMGRETQKNFLTYGTQIIRACLLHSYDVPQLSRIEGEELEFIRKFSPFVNEGNCESFAEEINKAVYHIERNANPKILFLDLSLKINELLNKKVKV